MQFSSLRGALTAAAMMLVTLCGAAPGAAREAAATPALGGTPPAALVRAATSPATAQAPAMSGSAWIAQGTVVPTSPAQPTAAAKPIAMALATGALHVDSLIELVGDMPVDPALSPDLKCLAQAIYFEARGEPIEASCNPVIGAHQWIAQCRVADRLRHAANAPVEAGALRFVEARLHGMRAAGQAGEQPRPRRVDRKGEHKIDQRKHAVIAQSVEDSAKRACRAGGAGDHAVQPVGDQPADAQRQADEGEAPVMPLRIGQGSAGA